EGHQEGLGVITGGADSFLSKNKARSVDAFLSRWTKVFAIGFFLLVIGLNAIAFFK
ncbi:MAG: preprotein translocase subunit SecG, partial [Acutalibacteraceae bacterium]